MRGGSQEFYERYRAAVESDIRTMAESDGLECVSVSARVADAGNLSHVKLVVRGRAESGRSGDRFGQKEDRCLLWSGRTGH